MSSIGGQLSGYGNTIRLMGLGNTMFNTNDLIEAELQMMELRNIPLQNQLATFESEKKSWNDFKSSLNVLSDYAWSLRNFDIAKKAVTYSQSGFVTATTSSTALSGKYSLAISQLAQQHQISGDAVADKTVALGYNGTVKINNQDFTVTSDMSLDDIVTSLNNNQSTYGVTASVIANRLVLTANETGTSKAISFVDSGAYTSNVSSTNSLIAEPTVAGAVETGNRTYNFVVNQLADNQISRSGTVPNTTSPLGYSGNFTINGQTLSVNSSDTLVDVQNKINALGTDITASIDGSKRLVLTGNNTGAANAFSITDNTTNGSTSLFRGIGMIDASDNFINQISTAQDALYTIDGVSYSSQTNVSNDIQGVQVALKQVSPEVVGITVDGQNNGILKALGILDTSDQIKNELMQATDASYSVNGIQLTSASNVISDAVEGVTFTLTQKTTSPVDVTIAEDTEASKEKIKNFVAEYNKFVNALNAYTQKGATLQGKGIPINASLSISSVLSFVGIDGTMLHNLGIEVDGTAKNGTLKINETKLNNMLETSPDKVENLFFGETGLGKSLYDKIQKFTSTTGSISTTIEGLDKRIEDINDTLAAREKIFEKQRETLLKKYSQFESQLAILNSELTYVTAQMKALTSSDSDE